MVEKSYAWLDGAVLEEHTKLKHKILREYIGRYLTVRCAFPQQSKFRLAIIDGFAGGGRYACGTPGSPLIFIEELRAATETFNVRRATDGMAPLDIECFLVLNDRDPATIELLKTRVEPMLAAVVQEVPRLYVRVEYRSGTFEAVYPEIKQLLTQGRYQNVLFNLDQCGSSHVERSTLADILSVFHVCGNFLHLRNCIPFGLSPQDQPQFAQGAAWLSGCLFSRPLVDRRAHEQFAMAGGR